MGKSLVIVESPAKAKTINKYLGKDFIVKSSIGHIRDLPVSSKAGGKRKVDPKERAKAAALTRKMDPDQKAKHKAQKAKEQQFARMGINPEKGWEADYEILPGKEKVIDELQKLAAKADKVYLATDLDREGEAIAWHLSEVIDEPSDKYARVVFNEITKKAIQEAFKAPGVLNMDMVHAQQTRRFLDRVVGFMVSPLLWAKVARGLSAGRVQSVAVRLIVEREREIRAFIPEEYWNLFADLNTPEKKKIRFEVKKYQGKGFKPGNKTEADKAVGDLENASYQVIDREDKPTQTKPSAPFITSTLQQAASNRLGFSAKKIMLLAQRLYEAGHITYMRTDSTNLSADAIDSCRTYIQDTYGDKYLPESANVYTSKKGAQEAHEAIRPTNVEASPETMTQLEKDALRLYTLIWRQFVACQMPPATFLSTGITVKADDYELKARGRVITFDGFMKVQPPASTKEGDITLPDLKVDTDLKLMKLDPIQHFTKPTARYTEASLIKELEKRGIGRPATYTPIISTIQDRGYVRLESRRFYAEKIGDIVTDRLTENFGDLMDYSFTAGMEKILDKVAGGNQNWVSVLDDFFKDFTQTLENAYHEEKGMRPNTPTETNVPCPTCGRPMQIRTGGTGVFLGCSGYSLPPKERCKSTINLIHGDEVLSEDADDEAESLILRHKKRCSICGTAMDSYLMSETQKLHVCGNNPDCSGFEIEEGKFRLKGYDGPTLECDKCGAEMQLRTGRFGKYFACTNDDCTNTRKLLRSGEPAPPKSDPVPMPELLCQKVDDYYLLRDGASGIFLAASQFPKNRETRAPLVEELLPHKDEIDPKHAYLLKAPTEDPDGLKTVIRYSRKTKEQYVMTEKEGKATGWKAWYQNEKWVVEDKRKKKS